MNIITLITEQREKILDAATDSLTNARLKHYQNNTEKDNRQRLSYLLDLAIESMGKYDLGPIVTYAQHLASERFNSGFEIAEVLSAINVLEEAIWQEIVKDSDASDYPEYFGLASTVLGAAKQALATEYVSLASRNRVESIDLTSLFRGT
jgi:hypothetical protein